MITRRAAIKQLFVFSAGATLIPSCLQNKNKASILLKNIGVDNEQEMLLAELAETIIPATNTPGAKDISAHLFALKYVDDCYKKNEQENFMSGLEAFKKLTKEKSGKDFLELNPQQREAILTKLESKRGATDALSLFYTAMKNLTIQAYTSSKFYLTKVHVYQLVPGPFKGCIPVTNMDKAI